MTRLVKPLHALKRRVSPNNLPHFQTGIHGELRARSWLCERGLLLIDHNLMIMRREIDILAYSPDEKDLWLAEVKTRLDASYAHPSLAVSWSKRYTMQRIGEWLVNNWSRYLTWWKQNPLTKLASVDQKTAWHSPHSLGFPKSARFAIISVFANQIDCIDASDW